MFQIHLSKKSKCQIQHTLDPWAKPIIIQTAVSLYLDSTRWFFQHAVTRWSPKPPSSHPSHDCIYYLTGNSVWLCNLMDCSYPGSPVQWDFLSSKNTGMGYFLLQTSPNPGIATWTSLALAGEFSYHLPHQRPHKCRGRPFYLYHQRITEESHRL